MTAGMPGKGQPPLEKSGDGHLVGGIQGARQRATLAKRLLRQRQAGKLPRRDFFEVELAKGRPIERTTIGRDALRDR